MVSKARKIKEKPARSKPRSKGRLSRTAASSKSSAKQRAANGRPEWSADLEHLLHTRYSTVESAIQDLASRVAARVYPGGKAALVAKEYLAELLLNDPQLVERLKNNLNITNA